MAYHLDLLCLHSNGNSGSLPPPHNIQDNDTYRLWSMVSHKNQSFLRMRNTQGQFSLLFDGNVDEPDFVNIQAIDVGFGKKKLFRLQFADPNNDDKVFMITGEREKGKHVVALKHVAAISKTPNEGKFEAITFYAFTMLRCFSVNGETDLYLASDQDGKALLINGGETRYPNPAMLFIANQII